MDLKSYNFDSCLFDPRRHSFVEDIEAGIPTFQAFKKSKDRKKIFAWIVCVYDIHSPLRQRIGNYYEKKRVCAETVGWLRDDVGHFSKKVEKYLLGLDGVVNMLIADYLASMNLPQFTQLVAYLEMQYKLTQDILKGKIESSTAKTMDVITKDIIKLTREVYGSGDIDEVMEARKALYAVAEKERMKLNIENIIQFINEKGDLPKDFNPYGDYIPDNIKFISDEGEEDDIGKL